MTWTVTIEVADCASASTLISGATVKSGSVFLGSTDANGQHITIADDIYDWVILTISKSGIEVCNPDDPDHHPGYISKNFTIHKDDDGTIQEVCLNESPPAEPCGEGIQCFIVTAATGSSESEEVRRLRQLRERVSAASKFGAQLIDMIYDEYEQFSPKIAMELKKDTNYRDAVRQVVVRPLFAWYTLAANLALENPDQEAASQAVQDVFNACPQNIGGTTVITLLEAIRAGEKLPPIAPPDLLDIVPQIKHLKLASWAILDPLIRVWRTVTEDLDVLSEVAQWLATAPIETLSAPSDPRILELELKVLAGFLDFRPQARPGLGERLLTAWPEAADALEQAEFVSPEYTLEKEL